MKAKHGLSIEKMGRYGFHKILSRKTQMQMVIFNDQKFSYTNYDSYGRPIESGVLANEDFSSVDADSSDFYQ